MYIILYGIIFHENHYIRISVLTDPIQMCFKSNKTFSQQLKKMHDKRIIYKVSAAE